MRGTHFSRLDLMLNLPSYRLKFMLVAAAALSAALLTVAPALAARGHEFAGAFGWGVVNGKAELQRCESKELPTVPPVCQTGLSGSGEGQFDSPEGVAVNEATGDVYVVDKANNRVEFFNAAGTKLEGTFDGSGSNVLVEGEPAGGGGLPEEVPTGQLDEPEEVAVDNSCVLLQLSEPKCKEEDPSSGDVYVVDTNGHAETSADPAVVDKFSASGEYLGQITRNPAGALPEDGFAEVYGVAVDEHGGVWVEQRNFGLTGHNGAAHYGNAAGNPFLDFRETVDPASEHPAPGFAVDSEESLYVHNTGGSGDALAKFSREGKLINPAVDEEAPTGVAVELGSDDAYIAHAANVHRVSGGGVSLESLKAPGSGHLDGVAIDSKTLTLYVADAEANRIDVFSPEAPGPPTVEAGSSSLTEVSATSASLAAEVNPRSEANEEATSYSFQYGPCGSPATCSSSPYPQSAPKPEGTLAPNYEPDPVGTHLQGLSPHTTYHVHVVARNSHGEGLPGEELVFTTQGEGTPLVLADDRQWELVSPPDKHGALLQPIEEGVIQAAASGQALSYLANAPTEAQPAGFSQAVQILSRRGASAWESQDIATPHEAAVGISEGGKGEYRFFSEELDSAVVQPFGPFTKELSAQGSERTAYLRDLSSPCGPACYRPLVSGCPEEGEACPAAVEEAANVPAGTKFGEEGPGECKGACGAYFLGASTDASHVVLRSKAALLEGMAQGVESLYEWAGGKLAPVSVLAGGQAVKADAALGYLNENRTIRIARHAVSTDGQRVIFSEERGNHHLYLREMAKEQTLELDFPEAACTAKGKCKGEARPVFQDASADDSRVFFTDSQPLTQNSGNSDLYECLIEESEEGQLACKLSDLTVPGAGEEGAGVLGLAAGASENGGAIYFTANGKLGEGPSPGGEEAVAGDCKGDTISESAEAENAAQRCNLYERAGGQTRLIAVLSGADFPDWSLRGGGLGMLSDRVSPDGRYLAFMSRRALSGYDNRDALSAKPDEEVFLYDSAGEGGQGALVCASCDPSGARPHGVIYKQINSDNGGLAGGPSLWPASSWIAASIPGWTWISGAEGFALHQSRYLADSGRLFFNAADALVPQDTNKTEDVYEYEPAGIGSCNSAQSTFEAASGGCASLISSGNSSEESTFLDAGESGDDVFFLTGQRLLPNEDVDQSRDIYDAHACSAESPCLPEAPGPLRACEGDACQSPGAPPEDQTPGSLTFQGPGNPTPPAAAIIKPRPPSAAQLRAAKLKKALKVCHTKHNKHKRQACEKQARRKYGAKTAGKKPTNKRRTR
jgi:DNA-binding beta-propeller fold protein YncE